MKKAKVFLTAFAVLAIVGSALAFKANYGTAYCFAPVPEGGNCLSTTQCISTSLSADTNGGTEECISQKIDNLCTSQTCPTKSLLETEPE